jgi:hypothetical protein
LEILPAPFIPFSQGYRGFQVLEQTEAGNLDSESFRHFRFSLPLSVQSRFGTDSFDFDHFKLPTLLYSAKGMPRLIALFFFRRLTSTGQDFPDDNEFYESLN